MHFKEFKAYFRVGDRNDMNITNTDTDNVCAHVGQ